MKRVLGDPRTANETQSSKLEAGCDNTQNRQIDLQSDTECLKSGV